MRDAGLSVVIPTYNETGTIAVLIKRTVKVLENARIPYEIIVVDDNSSDSTRAKVKRVTAAPVRLILKSSVRGKGFSIMEGAKEARYTHIAMIDADIQYPPEILPELYAQALEHGFSVANRKTYRTTLFRRIASRANAFIFGRLLLGLKTDVQSGLKVFPADVFDRLQPHLISAWAIDMPLIHTAYELGYKPGHVDMDFHPRTKGSSKVNILKTSWEIATGAIKTYLTATRVHTFDPEKRGSMLGAGMAYHRQRFTTHSTLPHHKSAIVTTITWQRIFLLAIVAAAFFGILKRPYETAVSIIAVLSTIYFLDVLFNLYVVLKSLHFPPELTVSDEELHGLRDADLPVYSVLCPLYKEAKVVPQFVEAMQAMDWPHEKLDVQLLLEEDDVDTIAAAKRMNLPEYIRINIVPDAQPKTKPKASNFGLAHAKGEYVVVFDAEDKPDPQQLKRAYLAFRHSPKEVVCLQAKLNYYNPHDNMLTRLFTAEYSLWFDVILPGLQSIQTTIPLGGTSNHFRTKTLIELHGWDPFNVTEDCDLGARIFASGYKTAIIDSTTLEEANSRVKNWFRQRSRWIKGYIQTYLVQMRNPVEFARVHGKHALIFQLIVGGRIAFMLINPLLWAITISYFTLYWLVGPTIESLYPTAIFYMAVISLVFGNFTYLYNYMIGAAKRGHWDLIKYTLLIPFYWLMMSWAAVIAVYQLFFKPHYWEKTVHGLHLDNAVAKQEKEIMRQQASKVRGARIQRLADLITSKEAIGQGALVASSLLGNILNFVYNAYLGRKVSLEEFGVISLIGSLLYIAQVPWKALSRAVTHKSAFLFGEYGEPIKEFWITVRKNNYLLAMALTGCWLAVIPLLRIFFQIREVLPFVLFTPVWVLGTLGSIDGGFLSGTLRFKTIALLVVAEALSKLIFSVLFVALGIPQYVYAAIPLSMTVSFAIGWIQAKNSLTGVVSPDQSAEALRFPKRFFITSILTNFSSLTYLSFDLLLAKHYLSPTDAGAYSFLTLVGKMVYFLNSLVSQFVIPLVSRDVGAGKRGIRVFNRLLILSTGVSALGVLLFGFFGFITVPLLWGPKASVIVMYLPMYTIAMSAYSITSIIITYHQIHKEYGLAIAGFLFSLVELLGMFVFHNNLAEFTIIVTVSAFVTLAGVLAMHLFYSQIRTIYRNIIDFLGLFGKTPVVPVPLPSNKLRVLIFNWRDLRHLWSGGAEVYIHELAKRWVSTGHEVTVFCGNDNQSPRYETVDGVRIVRRGGFYTVYLWAMLYYLKFFKGKYDVILDSENGIPFFTPLYAKEKVYLLIHHVHQEVFRKSLRPPLSWIALFLERRVMPVAYRKTEVITVSPSSKADILAHKLTKREPHIVYNGVNLARMVPGTKSRAPTVLYVGRLTALKSLNVLIDAVQKIVAAVPEVNIIIAGTGPDKKKLERQVEKLGLTRWIDFRGRVTEEEKIRLYQRAWVFVNPSLIEGWGITTIEANACGTPVVASNVAGLRDAVHNPHSGLLVPYGFSDEFATSIIGLLTHRTERTKMSKEARVWAEKFDWDKSADQSLEIISANKYRKA